MPNSDVRAHLAALYAASDDPWNTSSCPYEQGKFAQTMASLPRARYQCGLEVGCGAGALTAHLAPRCTTLVAMDCTAQAIVAARARVRHANVSFIAGAAPQDWPDQSPDLVVLSEVLYFMADAESAGLALRLAQDCAAQCHVVLVNWLGDTAGCIGGTDAAHRLIGQLSGTYQPVFAQTYCGFRIDLLARHGTTLSNLQAPLATPRST